MLNVWLGFVPVKKAHRFGADRRSQDSGGIIVEEKYRILAHLASEGIWLSTSFCGGIGRSPLGVSAVAGFGVTELTVGGLFTTISVRIPSNFLQPDEEPVDPAPS